MRKQSDSFMDVAEDVTEMEALYDSGRMKAFERLEKYASSLAYAALQACGSRVRAARWMCLKQRGLGGSSAYEALAQGELDRVWDLLVMAIGFPPPAEGASNRATRQ